VIIRSYYISSHTVFYQIAKLNENVVMLCYGSSTSVSGFIQNFSVFVS